jgi:tripartite motif-containing protein 2/3/tripartite motif-containing protein 71
MNQPVGIAISPLNHRIYVADNENHRVLVLSEEGGYRGDIGGVTHGTAPGHFFCPCGVALFNHPVHGELLIVSEWGGGRVQVIRVTDGSLFALYGGVSHAHDVVVDSEGIVYVTEYSSRKIKKFSLDGELVGGAEWSSSAVSLVPDAGGLHSVVMTDRVVVVLKETKKRRSSQP